MARTGWIEVGVGHQAMAPNVDTMQGQADRVVEADAVKGCHVQEKAVQANAAPRVADVRKHGQTVAGAHVCTAIHHSPVGKLGRRMGLVVVIPGSERKGNRRILKG